MDPSTFSPRAALILTGLGFDKVTIHKKTKDMSGGWRMRVALAKALFVKPSLLLLDDPTAHLDLEACVWLEEYLKKWERTLVLVSHSMDFLNGVCTNMIDMRHNKLNYYGGNYDALVPLFFCFFFYSCTDGPVCRYIKTRTENEINQMKSYHKQQEEIAHIKKFIASVSFILSFPLCSVLLTSFIGWYIRESRTPSKVPPKDPGQDGSRWSH